MGFGNLYAFEITFNYFSTLAVNVKSISIEKRKSTSTKTTRVASGSKYLMNRRSKEAGNISKWCLLLSLV